MRPRDHRNDRRPTESRRIVVGIHSSREAIRIRPSKVSEIWLKEGADRSHDLKEFVDFAKSRQIRTKYQPDGVLSKLSTSHQGVCLYIDETPELDLESLGDNASERCVLVALDEISDPHNIGAALRSAWLLGAMALILPEMRSGSLTPSAAKVASGGAEHVPVVTTANLQIELNSLKDKGFWIYGLAGEASVPLNEVKFNERVVLVIGSEDKGLRTTTRKTCDELVSIPQTDEHASLNASVATAVALYEIRRQHALQSKSLK